MLVQESSTIIKFSFGLYDLTSQRQLTQVTVIARNSLPLGGVLSKIRQLLVSPRSQCHYFTLGVILPNQSLLGFTSFTSHQDYILLSTLTACIFFRYYESQSSVPAQFLRVLCSICVVSSGTGSYFQVFGSNQDQVFILLYFKPIYYTCKMYS